MTTTIPGSDIQGREKSRVGRESDKHCPKCGATLLTNDYGQLWCSNVGSGRVTYNGCTFGMRHDMQCPANYCAGKACERDHCNCGYEEAHRDKS